MKTVTGVTVNLSNLLAKQTVSGLVMRRSRDRTPIHGVILIVHCSEINYILCSLVCNSYQQRQLFRMQNAIVRAKNESVGIASLLTDSIHSVPKYLNPMTHVEHRYNLRIKHQDPNFRVLLTFCSTKIQNEKFPIGLSFNNNSFFL